MLGDEPHPRAARSRHRHRPHARAARAARRSRRRRRPEPGDARIARARIDAERPAQRAAAPGRHLRAAGRARRLRSRRHPSGAALPRRSRRARCAKPRARCAPAAGCWSSISPRMGRSPCASTSPIAASASPTRRSPRFLGEAGLATSPPRLVAPAAGEAGKLTVALWLARDPRIIADDLRNASRGVRLMAANPVRLSRSGSPVGVSFEFFPPKTRGDGAALWEAIERLAPLAPRFRLGHLWRRRLDPRSAPTRRSRGSSSETHAQAGRASDLRRRLARRDRRGDPRLSRRRRAPYRGAARRSARRRRRALCRAARRLPDAPRISSRAIKRIGDFEVSVSAYPEKHPQSPTLLHDIEALEAQGRRGRRPRDHPVLLRQFASTCAFSTSPRRRGSTIPIVPGIVPVQNFKQTANFAKRAGASVPTWLADRFEGLEDDPATRRLVAAAVCAEQVIDLIDRGVDASALLYDEPRRPRLRDLPSDRPARAAGDGRGAAGSPRRA